ncbi:hypothetical protein FF100_32690 [Methylobacterium terricola]|uniref:Uncharacterized protein n=1 Tax=Methylobacterium terricola TaxID=2583531 RepID=A0A5C4L792_9HYPH|nr:hypothetical protein [Methylobacterium terricola]TNC07284.1 hypothetical protein FF100_32690 [Methylobacterium terricola]
MIIAFDEMATRPIHRSLTVPSIWRHNLELKNQPKVALGTSDLEAPVSAYDFNRTVVVWADFDHPEFGLARIESAIEAYDALHRARFLDGSRTIAPELWHATERAIDLALIDPSPANVSAAEQALLALVKRTSPIPRSVRHRLAPETCSSSPLSPRAIIRAMWPQHLIRELSRI